jgi:hypothetical protein
VTEQSQLTIVRSVWRTSSLMVALYAKNPAEIGKCEARTVANQCAPVLELQSTTQLAAIRKRDPNLLPTLV